MSAWMTSLSRRGVCRNDNNNSLFTNSNDNSEFFIVQKPSVNLPLCAFVVLWFTRCRGFQRTEDIGHRESAIRHRHRRRCKTRYELPGSGLARRDPPPLDDTPFPLRSAHAVLAPVAGS